MIHDVAFLHAPVSFRKIEYPLGGLFESATGTTDLLTMIPMGMLSLANELHQAGMNAVVVNVAKMFQQARDEGRVQVDLDRILAEIPARIFAIDLHWAAHTPGAIDLAQACKKVWPDSFMLLGGFTATRFHEEILRDYPFVDAVVLGECDGAMADIARSILESPRVVGRAPNLAYRDEGKILRTRRRKPDLTSVCYVDKHNLMRPSAVRARLDRETVFLTLPVVRGCNQNCLFCGGSCYSYSHFLERDRVEVLPVDRVLDHIKTVLDQGLSGVKFFGDLRLGGDKYVRDLIDGLASLPGKLDLAIELFWPATREFLSSLRKVARSMFLTLSPESSIPEVRALHGKCYDNETLLEQARICADLDISAWFFFVYLLPGQTRASFDAELSFMEQILAAGATSTVNIQPYLFLDPSSELFENPEKYGFSVRLKSIADLRANLQRAYWFHSIGYRSKEISEWDFFRTVLDITLRTAEMYFRTGRLSGRDLLKTHFKVECNRRIGEILEQSPNLSDSEIQQKIEKIFPESLRRSNTCLLVWPFLGEAVGVLSSPDAMVFDAFPAALELRLRARPTDVAELRSLFEHWYHENRLDLLEMYGSRSLPTSMEKLARSILAPLSLPEAMVEDLPRFEWDMYRFLYFQTPDLGGPPYRTYRYDFTSIDELVKAGGAPVQRRTHYQFDPKRREVFSMQSDAGSTPLTAKPVRRMSMVERRLVRAERLVLQFMSRGQKYSLLPEDCTADEAPSLVEYGLDYRADEHE